jgi:hypothetical protein
VVEFGVFDLGQDALLAAGDVGELFGQRVPAWGELL